MSNEIQLNCSLRVNKVNLQYVSSPNTLSFDMDGEFGPTPGCLNIPVGGKSIPLGELRTAGICWMCNLDETNYVEYGIYDPDTDKFYPLGELLPGLPTVILLSRNLMEEYEGTGTGTSSATNQFFMKADTADCKVRIDAFER